MSLVIRDCSFEGPLPDGRAERGGMTDAHLQDLVGWLAESLGVREVPEARLVDGRESRDGWGGCFSRYPKRAPILWLADDQCGELTVSSVAHELAHARQAQAQGADFQATEEPDLVAYFRNPLEVEARCVGAVVWGALTGGPLADFNKRWSLIRSTQQPSTEPVA